MASNHIRAIGFICCALMILLAILGLIVERRGLATLGSIGFILPVYAYFMLHMSFLAGLGILTALWAPFWGDLVKLGDIAYLPYMILVYPFSLIGMDIRKFLAGFIANLGLLIFILGVLAWFYARFKQKNTVDFWIYRFTRHPQYLGWILWSYGLMLRVAHRHDTALQDSNPGASLPELGHDIDRARAGVVGEGLQRSRVGQVGDHFSDDMAHGRSGPRCDPEAQLGQPFVVVALKHAVDQIALLFKIEAGNC